MFSKNGKSDTTMSDKQGTLDGWDRKAIKTKTSSFQRLDDSYSFPRD